MQPRQSGDTSRPVRPSFFSFMDNPPMTCRPYPGLPSLTPRPGLDGDALVHVPASSWGRVAEPRIQKRRSGPFLASSRLWIPGSPPAPRDDVTARLDTRPLQPPLPSRRIMKASFSNRLTSCSFFRSAPWSGRDQLAAIALAQGLWRDILRHEELEPIQAIPRWRASSSDPAPPASRGRPAGPPPRGDA